MALYARLRRRAVAASRQVRMARVVAKAIRSNGHPVLAQIVPIRRCNLACGYCSEYDKTSAPVPLDVMRARIDHLAALGTSMVDLSGGEPLLHPDADEIIRHIRACGMTAGLLTNGYLLTPDRIRRLNRAGLDRLQISIDNVQPDDVSYKSLKVLDRKLEALAAFATFDVNINTVVGAGVRRPSDALVIARRARALGFGTSVGLVHDSSGQIIAVNDNWVDSPNRQAIIQSTIPPSNNLESAILMSLQPGAYTATVRGVNHTTGIALVETYDLDRVSNSRLANISTRGLVQTNDDVLIAGMIVAGQTPQRVIVRATGPSLEVPGRLANPSLELRDGDGNVIRSNDNWRSDQEAEITSTTIAPTNDLESAIVATLPANGTSYTAIVRGADGGTGVSVIEVYGLNN